MSKPLHRTPVVTEPIEATVKRLETYVQRMERRYEVASEEVLRGVSCHQVKETAEIGRWLSSYRALQSLRARGQGAGSRRVVVGFRGQPPR